VTEVQPNYWRATARFGFMEKPDILAVLKQACSQDHSLKLGDVVYYVGRGTIVPREDGRGLAKWQDALRYGSAALSAAELLILLVGKESTF